MKIGYVRVSSIDNRQQTDLQVDALKSAGVDERHIFQDRASGCRGDRPGLKQCLDFLKAGDVLVVWKLDRLGRSLAHLLHIVTELRERGVGFCSLTESIDTTTPMGEFMLHLFAALAQYERSLIRERVQAGLESARRRGRRGGRPRRMGAEQIGAARALIESGRSVSAVARSIGVARSTLIDSLQRPIAERDSIDGR
jgi:DNA invertase Pin-like site-specific DNA recombinase